MTAPPAMPMPAASSPAPAQTDRTRGAGPAAVGLLPIGAAARRTGCSPQLLRHYEAVGLLPAPPRSSGRRLYGAEALARLAFIRRARALGFTLAEIAALARLAERPDAPCAEAHALAGRLLAEVRVQRAWLEGLERRLAGMAACAAGEGRSCRVIAELGATPAAPAVATAPASPARLSSRRRRT